MSIFEITAWQNGDKGFSGTVEYSPEDDVLFGKLIGINGLVSYEGKSIDELKDDFREAVDDYVDMCRKKYWTAEKL